MNTEPLTSAQLDNAYFNLLSKEQKEMMADFGRNMYSDFLKYESPQMSSSQSSRTTRLSDEEEIMWLEQQIKSGLLPCDIDSRGKKLLRKKYGKNWQAKIF